MNLSLRWKAKYVCTEKNVGCPNHIVCMREMDTPTPNEASSVLLHDKGITIFKNET